MQRETLLGCNNFKLCLTSSHCWRFSAPTSRGGPPSAIPVEPNQSSRQGRGGLDLASAPLAPAGPPVSSPAPAGNYHARPQVLTRRRSGAFIIARSARAGAIQDNWIILNLKSAELAGHNGGRLVQTVQKQQDRDTEARSVGRTTPLA
jgi:hypothetical protein